MISNRIMMDHVRHHTIIRMACSLVILFCLYDPLPAADFGIGAMTYYATWQPAFTSYVKRWGGENVEAKPLYLAGPILTMKFLDDWDISAVGLFSIKSSLEEENHDIFTFSLPASPPLFGYSISVESKSVITRNDIDLTIGCKVWRYIKAFVGYKFMSTRTGDSEYTIYVMHNGQTVNVDRSHKFEFDYISHAGGIGLGLALPVVSNFYIVMNSSFLYAQASMEISLVDWNRQKRLIGVEDETIKKYSALGVNSTLSLSYYFDSISTSIVLTGRYQFLRYNRIEDDVYYIRSDDIYYGVMLSAVFYYSIGSD